MRRWRFCGYLWRGQIPAIEKVPDIGRLEFFVCRGILIFNLFQVSKYKLEQEGRLTSAMRFSDKLKKYITESKNICETFSHQYF